MQPGKNKHDEPQQPDTKNVQPSGSEHVKEAHQQADADISNDPDFMPGNKADDLDEAESVKLNDDENDLI